MVSGLFIIISNLIRSARVGPPAVKDPWGGKTLEWTVDSPPSLENFKDIPEMKKGPYEYENDFNYLPTDNFPERPV